MRLLSMTIALGAVLAATGCGADNPGEPRTPAEQLVAPKAGSVNGKVHVYCVEEDAVPVTPCNVWIDVDESPPAPALRTWWLRASRALRSAGTFTYKGEEWRFNYFAVDVRVAGGDRVSFGWRCPSDIGKAWLAVVRAMDARSPIQKHGIQTLAQATRRGCTFARYPEAPTTDP